MVNTTKKIKLKYLGHIMQNEQYGLLHLISQNKVEEETSSRCFSEMKILQTFFTKTATGSYKQRPNSHDDRQYRHTKKKTNVSRLLNCTNRE